MNLFSRKFAIAMVAAGSMGLGLAPSADAGLVVTLQQTSGPHGATAVNNLAVTTADGISSATFGGTFGDFSFQSLSATSNATDAAPGSLGVISFSVRNKSTGTATIVITSTDNTFTVPAGGPLQVQSTLSSSSSKVTGSGTFVSNADGVTSSPLTLSGFGSIATSFTAPRPNATYTLGNTLTVTLAAGESLQLTGTTFLAPEPATLAMAFSGLPLVGLALYRRRKAQV